MYVIVLGARRGIGGGGGDIILINAAFFIRDGMLNTMKPAQPLMTEKLKSEK